jgi:hypothetical protein
MPATSSPTPHTHPLRLNFDAARVATARTNLKLKPDPARALFMAEKMRPDFMYHTAALEGNPFTFPEVKTLIEGITVGGHKQSDAEQVLNLNLALTHVIGLVKAGTFKIETSQNGDDSVQNAFLAFLQAVKPQSVYLATGALLAAGLPPFYISLKDQLIYNQVMARFYRTQDATEVLEWLYGYYFERVTGFGFDVST